MRQFIWPLIAFEDIVILIIISALILRYYLSKSFKKISLITPHDFSQFNLIITGAATGSGKQLVTMLCKYECYIIILDEDQLNVENNFIFWNKNKHQKCKIQYINTNLSSSTSVEAAAKEINKRLKKINYLINNATVQQYGERIYSQEGIQYQMATNYLGHCRLTFLLFQTLKKTPYFRIINIGSTSHKYTPFSIREVKVNFDDFFYTKDYYNPLLAFSKSKLYLAGFTIMLAYQLKCKSIKGKIIYLDPGRLIRSKVNIVQYKSYFRFLFYLTYPLLYIFSIKPSQAAQIIFYFIIQKYQLLKNGIFYNQTDIQQYSKQAQSKQFQRQLWKHTIEYIKPQGNWQL